MIPLDASQPVELVMMPATLTSSGTTITSAARALCDSGSEEVVVVDADGRPLGVFAPERIAIEWCSDPRLLPSERSLGESGSLVVDELMVPIRARLAPGSTIAQACALLAGAHCTRAIVVGHSGRLLGVITAAAVFFWVAASMRASAPALARRESPSVGA